MRTHLEARKDRRAFVRRGIAVICLLLGGAATAAAQIARTELVDPTANIDFPSYGHRVALSGDGRTALVGGDDSSCAGGAGCGKADVFSRQGDGTWVLTATLVSPAPVQFEHFGFSLALSQDGTIALIGGPGHNCPAVSSCGAAYVFELQGGVWTARPTVTAADPQPGAGFGTVVSLSADGGTAMITSSAAGVGSGGAVYVFTGTGSAWSQMAKLTSPVSTGHYFGLRATLSRDGTTILAAARECDDVCAAGYVFVRSGATWAQQAHLDTQAASPMFDPITVALSADGNTALLGASHDCSSPQACPGLSMFERNGTAWSTVQDIQVPGAVPGDRLGYSFALSDDGQTLWLGAPGTLCDIILPNCGVAYLLKRSAAGFDLRQVIPSPFAHRPVGFPEWIATSADGTTAVMGMIGGPETAFAYSTAGLIPDAPTLGGPGLAALAVLLAAAGAIVLRRRIAA